MSFTELARYEAIPPRTIVRGVGTRVYDAGGREYLDALSSLFCVNIGHGRREIAAAMARQTEELAYFPAWDFATPPALELADRIAALAPGELDYVFFTSGGAEAVDAAWKIVRQYHRLRGKPTKIGILAREGAYHGTTLGALPVTGIASLRAPFEPIADCVYHGPKVDPFHADTDPESHSVACAEAMAELVERIGADNLGAIVVEPIQNAGGCLVPELSYYRLLRELCDAHDLLLVSDETICSWGRLGTWFGCEHFGYQPDLITTAKGLTSAYAPMGAVVASARVVEPFLAPGVVFNHGLTFGGHPVAAAAALENIAIMERERLCERAVETGALLRSALLGLSDIPLVGDVRGVALFQAIELVRDRETRTPLEPEQIDALKAWMPACVYEGGLICRVLHRGAPIVQFAPPLVTSERDVAELAGTLRTVLTEAAERVL
jgi:adenosylmethionine-8-amino-7-oxononanoate aminotransferase